jgi:hypothetical protein
MKNKTFYRKNGNEKNFSAMNLSVSKAIGELQARDRSATNMIMKKDSNLT